MQTAQDTAQILDFTTFREQHQEQDKPANAPNLTPMLIWYPMWVLVPATTTPPQT